MGVPGYQITVENAEKLFTFSTRMRKGKSEKQAQAASVS